MLLYRYVVLLSLLGLAVSNISNTTVKGKSRLRRRFMKIGHNVRNLFIHDKTTAGGDYDFTSQAPKKSFLSNMRNKFVSIFKGSTKRPMRKTELMIYRRMPARPLRGWIAAEFGKIPNRAFMAGFNGHRRMYVARAIPRSRTTYSVGYILQGGSPCAKIPSDGYTHCYRKYQVLVGEGFKWMDKIKAEPHPDAVVADDLTTAYVCRSADASQASVGIGYVTKDYHCWFDSRGREVKSARFELLLDMWVDVR